MPIGDVDAFALHGLGECGDRIRVRDRVNAVPVAVRSGARHHVPGRRELRDRSGGVEQREHGTGIHSRRAQQLEPVGLWLWKGPLMREHYALAELVQAQGDEHLAPRRLRCSDRELVLVDVQRGGKILSEHMLLPPRSQQRGRADIPVSIAAWELCADEVV